MEPDIQIIYREIPEKKKGYLVIRSCPPERLSIELADAAEKLFQAGALHVYAASTDPAAPLAEGVHGAYQTCYVHDMLGMERDLGAERPRPEGRLTLEPLTAEAGGAYLKLLNSSFFDVPNSATNDTDDLKEFLEGPYRCGFALLDGARAGIYECGFKKEHPEIGSIGLDEKYRGQGLGRELLLTVMDYLAGLGESACWLQVSTINAPAYHLYRSVGFTLDRVLARWYEVARAHG